MPSPGAAVPLGADVGVLGRLIAKARDSFLSSGVAADSLRPVVAASWQRSLRLGLDPQAFAPPVELDGTDLVDLRAAHPLAAVMPVVRRLLVDQAAEAGLLVAVSDERGRLLWVEGSSALRRRAEHMMFVEGARWSEDVAGTNAPGTALALGQPVQIFAAEHLASVATPWSCAAAPVHSPDGRVLGTIDVTGGDEVAGVQSLLLVRATVAAVEAELRQLSHLRPSPGTPLQRRTRARSATTRRSAPPRLEVLARRSGAVVTAGRTTPLRLRHAEILLLLSAHPQGLSGDQLGILLNEQRTAAVTLRADLSRLRLVLGQLGDEQGDGVPAGTPQLSGSPYRLTGGLASDYAEVRRLLAAGKVRQAVSAYRGPVLPDSLAPGVEAMRDQLAHEVRACVIALGDADLVWAYANRPDVAADPTVWQACHDLLPAGSPRRPLVLERIRHLDDEYR